MSRLTTPGAEVGHGAPEAAPASRPAIDDGDADRLLAALGTRLAEARRRRGVTLAVVAGRSGLSPAYVSQIESGAANPTLRALSQVAAAVGVRLSSLLDGPPAPEPAAFAPRVNRAALAHGRAGSPGVWEHTAPGSTRLVARLVHGEAGDHGDAVRHQGEEYVLVVRGSCRLHVDGAAHELASGDACHFPAGADHRLDAVSDDLTLCVVMSAS
ncbi:helix-turn-helix domain-containing protein [Jatrophihabitans fulvus]